MRATIHAASQAAARGKPIDIENIYTSSNSNSNSKTSSSSDSSSDSSSKSGRDVVCGPGPAERSGLVRGGDQLVSVNGVCVWNLRFEEVVEVLRNSPRGAILLRFQASAGASAVWIANE